MSIFTQIQLKTYIKRIELQKYNLPLATVFNEKQKEEIDAIYDQLLLIYNDANSTYIEVLEPTYL
ncbi:hypothetical protein [Flavobacterium chilense]|uniref:Uncharacterized protein n=1 Tax=Flavobacterium chilense TaxID=946677 RepID=A0A1M7L2R4_9FLAO|nr:hypothetical protein [Flavobacterium chilense]SHM72291.1 hypothetical protein SAMN05444484_108241 [Flavobacterium chilense]